ncbi:MAG: tail fiber protein, partial [Solibacillus sp.]|uniref:tail fiber protein n=1 Tax=Solibacillus sp. TaxID=1909654 RepID=UPI0033162468
ELGHVKIGQGLTISEDGTLNAEAQAVPNASTTIAGITKLNDSLTSTSTSEAATTNAAKKLNDAKLNRAGDTMTGDLTINKGIPRVYLQVPGVDYTTEFRNNASPTNDFGFDIYRKNIRALHISPSGAVWVRDNAGVEFNLGDLKSSVSNGKSAIASAISDGGVYTSPIASFADMANN